MQQIIKQTLNYFKWDWPTLLLFELIHKLVLLGLIIPTFFSSLTYFMQRADLTYLSPQVTRQFILAPSTLLLGLLMILSLGFYFFLEIQAIYIYYQCAIYQQRLSIFKLILKSLKQSFSLLHPKNIILLFIMIFFIPITAFIFKLIFLDGTSITEFLFDFIYQRAPLHPMYLAFIVLLELLSIRFIFIFPLLFYKKSTFIGSCRESLRLTKGNIRELIPLLISWSLFIAIFLMLIYALSVFTLGLVTKLTIKPKEALMIFLDTSFTIKNILTMIAPSLIIVGNCSFIFTLYTQCTHSQLPKPLSASSKHRHPFILSFFVLLLIFIVSELISPTNLFHQNKHFSDEMQIIAHRAAAVDTPENTLSALNYSIMSGAHMAEIDVQQTSDRQIILMHDSNLKRTTGVNLKVNEASYLDITRLDAGSWFSAEFIDEPVPTLEEALQISKDKITLMIEIKSRENAVDTARQVIQLIENYDMEKQCIIGSMDYRVLQAVKMLNKKIPTVYITALAYGDYQDLEDVDFYSIEASFISFALIDQIHRSGKQIYAWTVNKESTMQALISMQVDGIVTDDPVLLQTQLTHISDKFISFIADCFFDEQPIITP